ncbi:MAG: hypothetical protein H7338_06920 [Candidatus Sericytochromatia bacterium]|nr:hypothetical protein [Candidatus Sericytochromatia bacterium]
MELGATQGPVSIDPMLLDQARQISAWMDAGDLEAQQQSTLEPVDTNAVAARQGQADSQATLPDAPSPDLPAGTSLPVPDASAPDIEPAETANVAAQSRLAHINRHRLATPAASLPVTQPVITSGPQTTPKTPPIEAEPAPTQVAAVTGRIAEAEVSAKTNAAMASMPGATWAGHLASNGGREVAILIPPGVDFTKPVEMITFFHGLNGSIADKLANPETNIKAAMLKLAKGKNAVFVLPNGSPAGVSHTGARNATWMDSAKEPGQSIAQLQDDAAAQIKARWAPDLKIGSQTVAGHSGGGKPIANAAANGTLRADHIVLLDATYGDWGDQTAAYGRQHPDTRIDIVYTGGDTEKHAREQFTNLANAHRYRSNVGHNLVPRQFLAADFSQLTVDR